MLSLIKSFISTTTNTTIAAFVDNTDRALIDVRRNNDADTNNPNYSLTGAST